MGDVIDLSKARKEKAKLAEKERDIFRAFELSKSPEQVIMDFEEEAEDIGPEAMDWFPEYFEQLTHAVYFHGFDSPLQKYVTFFDILGEQYICGTRKERSGWMTHILNYVSEFPDDLVSELMLNIDEPWLVMDYLVNDIEVLPDIKTIEQYVRQHRGGIFFAEERDDFSRFWLADAVLRFGNLPSKRNLEMQPDFLERSLDAIAGICYARSFSEGYQHLQTYDTRYKSTIEDRIEHARFIEL